MPRCFVPSLLVALTLSLLPAATSAAVPASDAVVAKARTVHVAPPADHALVLVLTERAAEGQPRRVLRVVRARGERWLEVEAFGAPVPWPVEETPPADLPRLTDWVDWLHAGPSDAVLAQAGVDRGRTSLGLAGRTVLWVVGAGPREPARPQVAIERATGRLRRWHTPLVQVTFDGAAHEARWPALVTFTRDGRPPLAFELTEVRLVPDALAPAPPAPRTVPPGP